MAFWWGNLLFISSVQSVTVKYIDKHTGELVVAVESVLLESNTVNNTVKRLSSYNYYVKDYTSKHDTTWLSNCRTWANIPHRSDAFLAFLFSCCHFCCVFWEESAQNLKYSFILLPTTWAALGSTTAKVAYFNLLLPQLKDKTGVYQSLQGKRCF